jgi:lipopolysaccharide assembly protein A
VKVVQYLQVIALFALLAYSVLIGLENPRPLKLPLWGGDALEVPSFYLVGGAVLLGAAYAALLFLPHLIRRAFVARRERSRRKELEGKLKGAVEAKLATPSSATTPTTPPTPPQLQKRDP